MWGRDTCSPPCCVEMLGKYVSCNPQLHGLQRKLMRRLEQFFQMTFAPDMMEIFPFRLLRRSVPISSQTSYRHSTGS